MKLNFGDFGKIINLETLNLTNIGDVIEQKDLDFINFNFAGNIRAIMNEKKNNVLTMQSNKDEYQDFTAENNGKKYYYSRSGDTICVAFELADGKFFSLTSMPDGVVMEEWVSDAVGEMCTNSITILNGEVIDKQGELFTFAECGLEK